MRADHRSIQTRFASWPGFWPAVVACLSALVVLAALDPAGDHPGGFDGPGLTVDESFNVGQGVLLVDRLLDLDFAGFRRADEGLADHPLLGRIWIGLCHEAAWLVWPPSERNVPYSIACARVGPALAFAATVFIAGLFATRWAGRFAGVAASLSLALMPRMFGHAHIASLESCINLAYALVVLYVADRWCAESISRPTSEQHPFGAPTWWYSVLMAGVLFGLALLTKIQAVLLPIPLGLWALWNWRLRGVLAVLVWGLIGLIAFFALWPHLWNAPIDNFLGYLGRTTNRAIIQVWYQGQSFADRDVPWHYPWVLLITTMPLGLLLLGAWGLSQKLRQGRAARREWLVAGCLVFPLIVFSVPGIAVYDGERLFSVSFPLWALFAGLGAESVRESLAARLGSRKAALVLGGFLAAQSWGLFAVAPVWFSYYNLAVGGLGGAERLGLPVTYWGDGVTRNFLTEVSRAVEPESVLQVAPSLHPWQWSELLQQSPELRQRGIQFVTEPTPAARYVLLFPRKEYLPEDLRGPYLPERIVVALERSGVPLAVLYKLR